MEGCGCVGVFGMAGHQKGKMAWIGQQLQLWKAPKRLTALVMAAVVTWAGMSFILNNTVEPARNAQIPALLVNELTNS